jgi:hypothetical protein
LKKKSNLLSLLIALSLFFVLSNSHTEVSAESATQSYKVIIDGKLVSFTGDLGYPYLSPQNRTMVPIRIISENMGYGVTWDQATTTVTITGNGDTLKLPVGKNTAIKNGKEIYIDTQNGAPVDTKSVNLSGRVYVPIRFITEAMGGTVGYNRVEANGTVTHHITITTGKIIPPVATDPTFNPQTDVLPDGRLTKEKTTEYIEKMIDGTTLKKENGKYILEFNRPAIAEGYMTALGLDILTNSGVGNYGLSTSYALLPENKLPGDQSFTYELDASRLTDVNFYKFTLGVGKAGVGSSTSYEIWYWPGNGRCQYLTTNEWGAVGKLMNFDKNRLFEGI